MKFRKVTAIIRLERLEAVEECLKNLVIPGISVTKVKGFGEYMDFFKADWLCQHVRIEVFINVGRAEKVATANMHRRIIDAYQVIVVPRKQPDLVDAKQLYMQQCASCHGCQYSCPTTGK